MKQKNKILLLIAITLLFAMRAEAQFFQGIGITAGLSKAKQIWFIPTQDSSTTAVKKKNILGFNGSVRAEFINSDYIRWVTEFQFNQKGCKDKVGKTTFKNRLNYICWNNFLKLQFETFAGYPYLLAGPRLEYLLNQKTTSPELNGKFNKYNLSCSVGVGFEKIVYGYFKPFIEIHYNPDTKFFYAYENKPLNARNRVWEFRIGIIYRPDRNSCPSVIY